MNAIELCERGWVPDRLIRLGIRKLLHQRLQDEFWENPDRAQARYRTLLAMLETSPIALETDAANAQHYEVPAMFFEQVLGNRLKYSASCWDGCTTLDEAESETLQLYCDRAELEEGQNILDLGCGWGSLGLWVAERFPRSTVTAVSNSHRQREFITAKAKERRLRNINVITADLNSLELPHGFDRIVSVEMFEHMRNYQSLMYKIADWLLPGGKLFVHIFCHRFLIYPFETEGDDNWMGRYFFTGGLMPAADTLLHFQESLVLEDRWFLGGQHYQRTAEAWLKNLDSRRETVRGVLGECYGPAQADRWLQRWRMFFMACAELFGYRQGREWLVCHYRFRKRVEYLG